ncbi:hypothetical protein ACFCXG_38850, partial [Streptomyces sp. NPDC056295]
MRGPPAQIGGQRPAGAGLLLVPAEGPDGPALYAVDAAADGVRTEPLQPAGPAAAASDRASGLPPANRSTRSRSSGRIRAAASRLMDCSSENGSSSSTRSSPAQAGS